MALLLQSDQSINLIGLYMKKHLELYIEMDGAFSAIWLVNQSYWIVQIIFFPDPMVHFFHHVIHRLHRLASSRIWWALPLRSNQMDWSIASRLPHAIWSIDSIHLYQLLGTSLYIGFHTSSFMRKIMDNIVDFAFNLTKERQRSIFRISHRRPRLYLCWRTMSIWEWGLLL